MLAYLVLSVLISGYIVNMVRGNDMVFRGTILIGSNKFFLDDSSVKLLPATRTGSQA